MSATLTESEIVETQMEMLQETIRELEDALQDRGWLKLGDSHEYEFGRPALDHLMRWSRAASLANPIVSHAVQVQSHYVFGQGVSIKAAHADIRAHLQQWIDMPEHQDELLSQQALIEAEQALTVDGNLFLTFFTNPTTGEVRMRSIPMEQIRVIVTNPDDRRDAWYYQREWVQGRESRKVLLADWRYEPQEKPSEFQVNDSAVPIDWSARVFHVRAGGMRTMLFGMPQTYSALPWAKAVKEFHEASQTVRASQAKFAAKVTTPNKRATAAVKTRLGTTVSTTNGGIEGNPPPGDGSLFVATNDYDYQLLKLSGNAPKHDEARGLVLMAAAGLGIPETILMGDADVGNLATSKTLDRPTELKMRSRQVLWAGVLRAIMDYIVDRSITAPSGALKALAKKNADGTYIMKVDAKTGNPIDRHIDIDFPSILERDTKPFVEAVVMAFINGALTVKQMAALIMGALGMDDIDEELAELFPEDEGDDGENVPRPTEDEQEARFAEALRDVRAALVTLAGGR